VRCRDDVERSKPAPDLYLSVCECLGVAPTEAIALEDSANGIAAAKAAGLRCVAIPNPMTAELDLSAADLRLDSLAAITVAELLERLA
jgi:putative hydrolase of the HAD superfamily